MKHDISNKKITYVNCAVIAFLLLLSMVLAFLPRASASSIDTDLKIENISNEESQIINLKNIKKYAESEPSARGFLINRADTFYVNYTQNKITAKLKIRANSGFLVNMGYAHKQVFASGEFGYQLGGDASIKFKLTTGARQYISGPLRVECITNPDREALR